MPPKKVYKFPNLLEAETSIMTFDTLQNYCLQLFEQILIEKKEAEKFQGERDKLLNYWTITGDNLREVLYDLRDQQLLLENEEYSMKTRMDRTSQEMRRLNADASESIEDALVRRCAELAREHNIISEKNHQVWSDVQQLKTQLVDLENNLSEAITDRAFVRQQCMELVATNMLKQRILDLTRLKRELRYERKKYASINEDRFRKEIRLKRDVMKTTLFENKCALKKLVNTFDRILSYNFEKVSDLKDQAENLKKKDIMLSKEFSEASKSFYKSVSSHAEGMRTLNQMRTFLYAAGKTERSLVAKKKELALNQLEAEALSVKKLNTELKIKQLENRLRDLRETVISYRRKMTQMFRDDSDIMSRNLEKCLMELFQQKVKLYSLVSPEKNIDLEWDTADIGGLTYRTEKIGEIHSLLRDFRTACVAVVTLYKRLFKMWHIKYDSFGVILNERNCKRMPFFSDECRRISDFRTW